MPDFAYEAIDVSGQSKRGSISAASKNEAIANLNAKQLFPSKVVETKPKGAGFSFGGVSESQMAVFYTQLGSLLRGGVPMLRSLVILREQTSNSKFKTILEDVHRRVEDGEGLGDAFARHPKTFNHIAINMSRAGAEGGFLDDALTRVGTFTEEQADLKARTVGSLAYPAILGVIGTIIISILLVFFVPMFDSMFETLESKGQMPAITKWLLAFSGTLKGYFPFLLGALIAFFLLLRYFVGTESGRRIFDLLKIRIPLFGPIIQDLAVARFCRVLGTLLTNGVPILRSLGIASKSTGNVVLTETIDGASENIKSGETLAEPLSQSSLFPKTVTEMIAVAEESNSLDTVLIDISANLEKKTTRRLDLAVKMVEPLMLVFMAGIILFVVVALLLPIMSMTKAA